MPAGSFTHFSILCLNFAPIGDENKMNREAISGESPAFPHL